MKYSQFGAILWTRISSCGENSVAPLCGLSETAVWRHYLRPKKALLVHFDARKSASKVLLYMKDLQMWAYCPHSRYVQYFIIHCRWLKINVDFRGESVRWSQTPSPLAYAVYAFINVDNCERPLNAHIYWRFSAFWVYMIKYPPLA